MKDNKTFPLRTAVVVHGLSHELLNGNYILNIREQSGVKSSIVSSFRYSLAVTSLAKYLPFRVRLWVRYASFDCDGHGRRLRQRIHLGSNTQRRARDTERLDLEWLLRFTKARLGNVQWKYTETHRERAIMNISDWRGQNYPLNLSCWTIHICTGDSWTNWKFVQNDALLNLRSHSLMHLDEIWYK